MKKTSFVIILILFLSTCSKTNERDGPFPVLGFERVETTQIEEQEDMLVHWLQAGREANRTLVHAAALSGMAPVDDPARLRAMVRAGDWPALIQARQSGKSLYTRSNYLRAAVNLGIVSRVYWVIPGRFLQYSDGERRIRALLAGPEGGLAPEEAESFRLSGGCVSGEVLGAEMHVCSPETLPRMNEPVLLGIDTGFLAELAAERGYSNLRGLKVFFDVLSSKGLLIRSSALSFSGGEDAARSVRRYLGMQAVRILAEPSLLRATAPSDLWAARDAVDNLFSKGSMSEVIQSCKEALERHPDDPALKLFSASAAALSGKDGPALDALLKMCRSELSACHAIRYLGKELAARGKAGAAERYARAADQMPPDGVTVR